MAKTARARYTLEFKEEAVRLVTGGQRVAAVAKTLGLAEQRLHNWVKAAGSGGLTGTVVPKSALNRWKSADCGRNWGA
ncbi:transposase [Azospirillum doebereinerae]|uniref:transposase n=1 Tax=Azospirillum doebereinerae TaxID=92933 RepID=UPI00385047CA